MLVARCCAVARRRRRAALILGAASIARLPPTNHRRRPPRGDRPLPHPAPHRRLAQVAHPAGRSRMLIAVHGAARPPAAAATSASSFHEKEFREKESATAASRRRQRVGRIAGRSADRRRWVGAPLAARENSARVWLICCSPQLLKRECCRAPPRSSHRADGTIIGAAPRTRETTAIMVNADAEGAKPSPLAP